MFHIDELFSFAHANSTQGAFLVKGIEANAPAWQLETYLDARWFPGKFFHTWLTVQPEEAFKYGHIFENLAVGVHPPLFYILLHTVCSFTPDVLSKWSGGVLNIILWIILLWALFRLAKLFLKDSFYAGCVVLFYAYSQVGLATVMFIRGYLLQTLLAVGFVYSIARVLQDNRADWKRCLQIGVLAVLGMLTHYNFIVFAALTGIITGIVLCWRKQWHLCVRLAIVLSASFVCFLLLFPPAMDVLIASMRGREAVARYQGVISTLLSVDVLGRVMKQYLTWLWHGPEIVWPLIYVMLIVVLIYKYKTAREDRLIDWLLAVAGGMCLYTNFTMPEMLQWALRYSMLIFPLLAVVTIWYLVFCVKRLVRSPQERLTKGIVALVILFNSWAIFGTQENNPFAFYEKIPLNASLFAGKKVVFTYRYDLSEVLANAKQVFLVSDERPDHLREGLDEADFLIAFRHVLKGLPSEPLYSFGPEIQNRLRWIRRFSSVTYEYDLYAVKPKEK